MPEIFLKLGSVSCGKSSVKNVIPGNSSTAPFPVETGSTEYI